MTAQNMNTKEKILKQLAENPILIYMKGVPSAPECGFSEKAVNILKQTNIPYAYIDVLKAPFIRDKLPSVSKWPTFPQLFIKGELIGGADIVETLFNDGSLLPMLQAAVTPTNEETGPVPLTYSEIEALIGEAYPKAAIDIAGQGCDLTITVISGLFEGQSMVKQHQGVMATLSGAVASGRLHAITLKTYTPEQWQAQQGASPTAQLLQIQL